MPTFSALHPQPGGCTRKMDARQCYELWSTTPNRLLLGLCAKNTMFSPLFNQSTYSESFSTLDSSALHLFLTAHDRQAALTAPPLKVLIFHKAGSLLIKLGCQMTYECTTQFVDQHQKAAGSITFYKLIIKCIKVYIIPIK